MVAILCAAGRMAVANSKNVPSDFIIAKCPTESGHLNEQVESIVCLEHGVVIALGQCNYKPNRAQSLNAIEHRRLQSCTNSPILVT